MNKTVLIGLIAFVVSNTASAAIDSHAMEGHSSMMNHQNMSSEHGAVYDTPTRNIAVTARDDMTFSPAKWSFKKGELVRFVITNEGRINHEFVIGGKAEMQEHAEMMKAMPHMEHEQGNAVSLNPGATRELVWRFASSGVFEAACNVPGHYEAGMKSIISVAAR